MAVLKFKIQLILFYKSEKCISGRSKIRKHGLPTQPKRTYGEEKTPQTDTLIKPY